MDGIAHLGLVDDDDIALDIGALELAALDHPKIDLAPYLATLDAIEQRLAGEADPGSSDERAGILARVVADEFGFVGDREQYDDPANADLIQVIDRRRGLPVSLAIIHVSAARRQGWSADALNTPGHLIARIGSEGAHVLVDPFNGGTPLSQDMLAALLAQVPAHRHAEHLRPMSNRDVLVRLLLNQATRAERLGDGARALELFRRITAVAPAGAHGWWERARLELASGLVSAARASLGSMLEMTRNPALRARILSTLSELPGAVH